MNWTRKFTLSFFGALAALGSAENPENWKKSELTQFYVEPTRIVTTSKTGVENANNLLGEKPGQSVVGEKMTPCIIKNTGEEPNYIVVDFGKQYHGGVEIFTGMYPGNSPIKVKVRLGESVSEVLHPWSQKDFDPKNDHAIRDMEVTLPWLGKRRIGDSGFRFLYIEALDPEQPVYLTEVRGVAVQRDLPYLGSFESSDERLNEIWKVGAHTVHLNMQDYLWDGIKRDRLVWVGDMHPEVRTIFAVFGANPVITKSLDLVRDVTPSTNWMNGIISYSMWWILLHEEYFKQTGDLEYLKEQKDYLEALLPRFVDLVKENGDHKINEAGMTNFIDWPTKDKPQAKNAGNHSLLLWTLEAGADLLQKIEGNAALIENCQNSAEKMKKFQPNLDGNKQAAGLQVIGGYPADPEKNKAILEKGKTDDFTTFYGYYMLNGLAETGAHDTAIEVIKDFWGAMLDLGATTFWEDFEMKWAENAGRIDEVVPEGKVDIHETYGNYCYKGFRHSFCHGWASGPTAWMSEYILGVKTVDTGMKTVQIQPYLGDLEYVKGTYPTPYGLIHIHHKKGADGEIISEIKAPEEVTIIQK